MRGLRERSFGAPVRACLELVRVTASVVLVYVIARAAYYPFWAASAERDDLEASWGGPTAIGATVAHWLVAAVIGAVCAGLLLVSTRLIRGPR